MCGTHLGSKTRKARKDHWCLACSFPIPAGFLYVISVDVEDGSARSSKWHVECWDEFGRMLEANGEDCGAADWTWENGLPEEVKHRYYAGPPEPTDQQWEEIEISHCDVVDGKGDVGLGEFVNA